MEELVAEWGWRRGRES